ncbi:MAG TPA: hypothetical protein VNE82_21525 [Candidatus Binataceae bacterium]|nr:hypothetical protein [Candidatus Binataceae bacterium]
MKNDAKIGSSEQPAHKGDPLHRTALLQHCAMLTRTKRSVSIFRGGITAHHPEHFMPTRVECAVPDRVFTLVLVLVGTDAAHTGYEVSADRSRIFSHPDRNCEVFRLGGHGLRRPDPASDKTSQSDKLHECAAFWLRYA